MEKWKLIPDYPNYEVSYWGQIRNRKTGKILKPISHREIQIVNLYYLPGKFRSETVSRLVMENFGKLVSGWVVRHLDGDPFNNHISNLECVPRSDHNIKNLKTGARKTKITEEEIKFILTHYQKGCRKFGSGALAEKFGVTPTSILKILKKKGGDKESNS